MSEQCDPKKLQDKSRKARFASNGEPSHAPGFDNNEPDDAAAAERELLRHKGKGNVSNLSGAFVDLDAAVSSIKSADSGTRS